MEAPSPSGSFLHHYGDVLFFSSCGSCELNSWNHTSIPGSLPPLPLWCFPLNNRFHINHPVPRSCFLAEITQQKNNTNQAQQALWVTFREPSASQRPSARPPPQRSTLVHWTAFPEFHFQRPALNCSRFQIPPKNVFIFSCIKLHRGCISV